jgi:myo-inositol 2-dehydrogenase/D-chiro-inositol 1-dehydrogenase
MAAEIKIGIIGAGRIGKLHGNNLAHSVSGARFAALAEPMLNDEHKQWAGKIGVKKVSKDPMDIINDKEIDAVFICSPTDTHADLIIKAAAAGKHIFCEKPIHTDIGKIKEALAAVQKAGVKLQVGFVRRFDHNHKKVRDTVASGRLGAPHIIKITSRDPEEPPMSYVATSGGLFVDMMIHDFDMARYLAGSEVTEVTAYGSVLIKADFKKYDDVDTAAVLLKFENGALGIIDNSRAARYGYDQRTEVHCAKGCVQTGNDLIDNTMISSADGVSVEKPTWFFLERYNNAFIAEVVDFINAIANDTEPPAGGKDGLMSVALAVAAAKSLKEGRPVKLSEILFK